MATSSVFKALTEDHVHDEKSSAGGQTGVGGGSQGAFNTCFFFALGSAMDTCAAGTKGLPYTIPLLDEGSPYALQAMGITNEDGNSFPEDGGGIYTLGL